MRHSATGGLKPVHVKTHGTGEDEHWLNMWTVEAERDSSTCNDKFLVRNRGRGNWKLTLE